MSADATLERLRDAARALAESDIRPIACELDDREEFPLDLHRKVADAGLLGISVPAADGGAGAGLLAYAAVTEELSRGYASIADEAGTVEIVATLLSMHGTPEQKRRWMPPLLRGETIGAFAVTEPDAGSDVSRIKTRALRDGDGWILSGGKMWISNAPICDFAIVLAVTDPEAGHRGMSTFIVDGASPGFVRGPKERKMGQRASQVGPLQFNDIRLPADALLGVEGRGFHVMMSVLETGRVGVASIAIGIGRAALEASIARAKEREQFGQPIAEFQAVQFMIADMARDLHAARLLTQDAARALERQGRASFEVSAAKCFATDTAVRVTSDAVQIHGGSGYIRGREVERLYRDAKITQIYEGTNQILRMLIARQVLA